MAIKGPKKELSPEEIAALKNDMESRLQALSRQFDDAMKQSRGATERARNVVGSMPQNQSIYQLKTPSKIRVPDAVNTKALEKELKLGFEEEISKLRI